MKKRMKCERRRKEPTGGRTRVTKELEEEERVEEEESVEEG